MGFDSFTAEIIKIFSTKKPQGFKLLRHTISCREDGIRTHDTVTHIQTFQACSFNHSDTSLFGIANNLKKTDVEK